MGENSPSYIRGGKEGNCPQYLFLIWKNPKQEALKKSRSDYNSRLCASGVNCLADFFQHYRLPLHLTPMAQHGTKGSGQGVVTTSLVIA